MVERKTPTSTQTVPPPRSFEFKDRIMADSFGAKNNNNSRPPQIDTHNRANVRLSTPHQKIRVSSIDYTPMGEEKRSFRSIALVLVLLL